MQKEDNVVRVGSNRKGKWILVENFVKIMKIE